MGYGSFNASAYRSFSSDAATKTADQIYTSRSMNKNLDPKGVKMRESRDSADNPQSTPLIVALDVTGSMGMIAEVIAKHGLGTLFTSILDNKPITDPHLMFMGIGDANYDMAPLQVSQFEADNRIVEQLTQLFLEHGGGGNNFESYNLAWYFAAMHTVHDSYEKRAKRGYLFTIGDEEAPRPLTKDQIKNFIGDDLQADMSAEEALELAQRTYNVYHIVIKEGNHAKGHLNQVMTSWRDLLGQHVVALDDHTKLAETIVSIIEVAEGAAASDAAARWGSASGVIHEAIKQIPSARSPKLLGVA